MTGFVLLLVISVTVVTCFKAYQGAKLLEKDPEAWSRLQQVEDEKRRRRQVMIGKGMVAAWQWVFGDKEEAKEDPPKKGGRI